MASATAGGLEGQDLQCYDADGLARCTGRKPSSPVPLTPNLVCFPTKAYGSGLGGAWTGTEFHVALTSAGGSTGDRKTICDLT